MDKELHILIGGTGTGKSTYSNKLKKELGIKVFCPDDVEERYLQFSSSQIDKIVDNELKNLLDSNKSFILDVKCLISQERIGIIKRAKDKGYKVYGYDFGAGDVVSFLRRLKHPRRFSNKFWEQVYESDKRLYQSPELDEGFEKIFLPAK